VRNRNVQRRRRVTCDDYADRDGNYDSNSDHDAQPHTEFDGDGEASADVNPRADRNACADSDEHAGSELADAGTRDADAGALAKDH
jgi:hypothetical protein